jgi:hypothetical protein
MNTELSSSKLDIQIYIGDSAAKSVIYIHGVVAENLLPLEKNNAKYRKKTL